MGQVVEEASQCLPSEGGVRRDERPGKTLVSTVAFLPVATILGAMLSEDSTSPAPKDNQNTSRCAEKKCLESQNTVCYFPLPLSVHRGQDAAKFITPFSRASF